MTREKPTASSRLPRAERRRSSRWPVVVPVEVRWQGSDGISVKEEARATHVNAQGALLQMKTYPEVGSRVELVNFLAADAAQARVLEMRRSKEGAVLGMAVELVVPSETFWGMSFQLKKTNAELFKLEQVLRSGGVDLRLLKEFHDAVDYVRTAAGAFEELRECQLQGEDTNKVLLRLTAERIRRTAYLCGELAADLDVRAVAPETKGMAELYQAVERIYLRLKSIFTYREDQRELAARR